MDSDERKKYRGEVSDTLDEGVWTLKKVFTRLFLPLLVIGILLSVVGYGLGWFGEAAEVAQDEFGARAAVRKYEWFKNKANSLSAAEKVIQITEQALKDFNESAGPRKDWTFEDKGERSRLTTDLRGQKAHFEQLKAEYRAACLTATKSVFKGDDKVIRWADRVTEMEE